MLIYLNGFLINGFIAKSKELSVMTNIVSITFDLSFFKTINATERLRVARH